MRQKINEEEFWSLVDIGDDDECWEWVGVRFVQRYGRTKYGRAHRIAYRLAKGPIPKGLLVCHKCDNPPCCNPNHLWLGTQKENIQDAIKKGRLHNEEQRRRTSVMQKGHITSEETRKKISKANSEALKGNKNAFGHHLTEDAKKKISEHLKGKHPTEETRKKLSEAQIGNKKAFGKYPTEEVRFKMSLSQKRRRATEKGIYQPRIVIARILDGRTEYTWI